MLWRPDRKSLCKIAIGEPRMHVDQHSGGPQVVQRERLRTVYHGTAKGGNEPVGVRFGIGIGRVKEFIQLGDLTAKVCGRANLERKRPETLRHQTVKRLRQKQENLGCCFFSFYYIHYVLLRQNLLKSFDGYVVFEGIASLPTREVSGDKYIE
ncbi:hypothetical protein TRIP_B200077 [uncultured Desulfatiglans sp.]|nr:hypothetical protein TRIP_B200077 [uncultured Desulfatiglans sp.]